MPLSLAIDFANPIPLFPLPNCVLLPHATLPLHVFEPRYRKMTSDALVSNKLIAMATFADDTWQADYENAPPLRPHVGIGHILRHDRLPDGRYTLLLQGICRAKIACELPSKPYRRAILEPTESSAILEIDLADHRLKLESLLKDRHLKTLANISAVQNWLSREIPTSVLADLTTTLVCDSCEEKYALLEQPCPLERIRWLIKHLTHLRHTIELANQHLPPSDHGQYPN